MVISWWTSGLGNWAKCKSSAPFQKANSNGLFDDHETPWVVPPAFFWLLHHQEITKISFANSVWNIQLEYELLLWAFLPPYRKQLFKLLIINIIFFISRASFYSPNLWGKITVLSRTLLLSTLAPVLLSRGIFICFI